jgi:hypothetical protein
MVLQRQEELAITVLPEGGGGAVTFSTQASSRRTAPQCGDRRSTAAPAPIPPHAGQQQDAPAAAVCSWAACPPQHTVCPDASAGRWGLAPKVSESASTV